MSEVYEQPALSDTAVVRITVLEALPDLVVSSLGINDTDIALNQTRIISGRARSNVAPTNSPFRLTFYHDGVMVRDTVVARLDANAEVPFNYIPTFNRLGSHSVTFEVDRGNQIPEPNETNNVATLLLNVNKAKLVVRPNPFTPNNDGFNDQAIFDFSDLVLDQPELKIFDFNGVLLKSISGTTETTFEWDGIDSRGREQKPGIYLYALFDGGKRVSGGYVALAR